MKILFIYSYANYEPLGLMTLSSVLKKGGHQCQYLDLKFEKNIIKKIKKLSPDIISYSLITGSHHDYKQFNTELKKHHNFIAVFGGPHCTFFPEFINEENVDVLCRGEGERAVVELAQKLQDGKEFIDIKNLWVKENKNIISNELDNLCINLDEIPFPDRDLVNVYSHYKKMQRRDVITSRGCPYNCTYCFNHANKAIFRHKGRYVRQRSVDNVIEEIRLLKEKYNTKKIHFQDDVFTVNRKWVYEFCEKYRQKIRLPFEVQLRVNLIDEDIVRELKSAGCTLAMYGIESGNFRLRNELLNRNISDEQILHAADLFRKYKIRTMSVNILGLPDETLEMAFQTTKLNIKCRPSYAWNSIYQPYPMTKLAEYSKQQGYFKGGIELLNDSFLYGRSVLKTKDIRKIERLHYLFSLAVSVPFLLPVIRLLTRLPFMKFFRFLFFMHRAYAAVVSLRRIKFSEIVIFEKSRFFFFNRNWND
ncbi:MAG: B12-binding domain-containing radical SAM protein [Bacteroidales bacterium]|jgi:radical SAM superfamily enzyme YgiQ (UPF0313 family)|nr:B12-binding domain-containing radical SAM protein [Bacteroidales bacterium]